jgi:glycosyltransferase involved in cell wall biosynthesis
MTDEPYVSVVIPTYNRSPFIVAAIESVLSQRGTTWPYEIIVVDDGSTDDTADVLRNYTDAIRYRMLEHSGLPAVARNVGVSEARGELIAFLDSDDVWLHDKLSAQVPLFDDPAVVLSYGQAERIYGDDPTPRGAVVEPERLRQGEDFRTLVEGNVISTLTTMVRRAAFGEVGGFDESPALRGVEDYELWLRISARYPRGTVALPENLALYRIHGDGLGSSDSAIALRRLLDVYESVWRCETLTREQRLALEAQLIAMHENWSRQQMTDGHVPAVSVVMSIYRDRPFAAQAVQSILDQNFADFEFIIVDDGSDDGTLDIVTAFDDPRIRTVRQTNHGLVDALNTGIRVARAPLIARQDADDLSLPNRLSTQVAHMAANPAHVVVGAFFRYVDEHTLEPTGVTITAPTKHLDIARHMYFDNPVGHGSVVMRRDAVLDAGGYSDAFGPNEDYDLWRRLVAAGGEIALIPEVHYLYRLNPAGISSTTQELQHRLFADLVDAIWRGPMHFKSFWEIAADSYYYKRLASPFRRTVHEQYKSHQIRLTVEFLNRKHFNHGLHTFAGALLISPISAARLGKALLIAYLSAALRRVRRLTRG